MGILKLVTGGARSGKSSYAQTWCEQTDLRKCFIATCPVTDPEMSERIRKHKDERYGKAWDTIEEQYDPAGVIPSLDPSYDILLIDCLTLWVNNLLYRAAQDNTTFDEQDMQTEANHLLNACNLFDGDICMVTNEVGLGIVPDNPVARKYRDLVGRCNRVIAAKADRVTLVSCGIPLQLK